VHDLYNNFKRLDEYNSHKLADGSTSSLKLKAGVTCEKHNDTMVAAFGVSNWKSLLQANLVE